MRAQWLLKASVYILALVIMIGDSLVGLSLGESGLSGGLLEEAF